MILSSLNPPLPKRDLDYIFQSIGESNWKSLSGSRIFITGGTGFIGKWLISSLLEANQRQSLNCRIEVLTRNPTTFFSQTPHIANADGIVVHHGDICSFQYPAGNYDLVIHAATDVAIQQPPLNIFETCFTGTKRILEFAAQSKVKNFLLTSSGAVYGPQPSNLIATKESFLGAPDIASPNSAYGEGKRVSEWLSLLQGYDTGLNVKIARIYAQIGPYLPLDKHFAIGNFILDAMLKRQIQILGDGSPLRSYLYAADTTIWLWAMIFRGSPQRVWNVGGKEAISISELALKISQLLDSKKGIKIHQNFDSNTPIQRYVPDVSRAHEELGIPSPIGLDEAIMHTVAWLKEHNLVRS